MLSGFLLGVCRALGWTQGQCGGCLHAVLRKNFARHVAIAHRGKKQADVPFREVVRVPVFKICVQLTLLALLATVLVANVFSCAIQVAKEVPTMWSWVRPSRFFAYTGPRFWEWASWEWDSSDGGSSWDSSGRCNI